MSSEPLCEGGEQLITLSQPGDFFADIRKDIYDQDPNDAFCGLDTDVNLQKKSTYRFYRLLGGSSQAYRWMINPLLNDEGYIDEKIRQVVYF